MSLRCDSGVTWSRTELSEFCGEVPNWLKKGWDKEVYGTGTGTTTHIIWWSRSSNLATGTGGRRRRRRRTTTTTRGMAWDLEFGTAKSCAFVNAINYCQRSKILHRQHPQPGRLQKDAFPQGSFGACWKSSVCCFRTNQNQSRNHDPHSWLFWIILDYLPQMRL